MNRRPLSLAIFTQGMLWSHVGGYLVSVAIILAGLGVLLKGELKTGPGGTDDVLL